MINSTLKPNIISKLYDFDIGEPIHCYQKHNGVLNITNHLTSVCTVSDDTFVDFEPRYSNIESEMVKMIRPMYDYIIWVYGRLYNIIWVYGRHIYLLLI